MLHDTVHFGHEETVLSAPPKLGVDLAEGGEEAGPPLDRSAGEEGRHINAKNLTNRSKTVLDKILPRVSLIGTRSAGGQSGLGKVQ